MNQYQAFHVQQMDEADCGVACLLSILRMYGGNANLERLREWSGTSTSGATLLGLLQAAEKVGLKAEGFEAEIKHLKKLEHPAILHVTKDEELLHFIVYYSYDENKDQHIIGDPGEPYVQSITSEELEKLWASKTLLLIKKTDKVKQAEKETLWSSLKWMSEFTKEDFNILFTSLAIGFIIASLGLTLAVFSQKLLDDILPSNNTRLLFLGAGLLIFLLMLRVLFNYIRELFLLRQSKGFNIRILDYFYQKLLFLPKRFFDSRKTGDLVARMNDTSRIQETISILFSSIAIDVIMILVSTVALLVYNRSVGLISLVWIPLFSMVVYRFNKKIIKAHRNLMGSYAMNESNYIDTIQGIGAIKVMVKENYFKKVTREYYSLFQDAQFKLGLVGLNFSSVAQVASVVFTIALIVYSSTLVFRDIITIGSVMAIIQLLSTSMASTGALANAFLNLQEARVALDRMKEFTELESEFAPETENEKSSLPAFNSLEVKGLDFRFIGNPLLLNDISFEVKKGEMIAILGESGCGKSTLLQIIQQFYTAEKGELLVNGTPVENFSLTEWRSVLGVVPQNIKIFNATLFENLTLEDPDNIDFDEFEEFMKSYGIDEYFKNFLSGYLTVVGETGINLSGGQQQMVALARALYQKPQLLLLDEATSAMDRNTEARILDLLMKLKGEIAIILVTHRIQTASKADRIYLIEDRKITHKGSHEELMEGDNFYSHTINDWQKLIVY